jgi:transcriptional regulator with XRE-family HTH domain
MNKAETAERVSTALRVAMTKAGLTQGDLGKRLGVTQGAVSLWVNGGLPSVDQLVRISTAFGWPDRRFLEEAGVITPAPLEETLRADPGLDDQGVLRVLTCHEHEIVATARRRSREPSTAPSAGLPAPVVESLSAQLLEASRGLAPIDTDILRAAVAVLLSVMTHVSDQDPEDFIAEMRRGLPMLVGPR